MVLLLRAAMCAIRLRTTGEAGKKLRKTLADASIPQKHPLVLHRNGAIVALSGTQKPYENAVLAAVAFPCCLLVGSATGTRGFPLVGFGSWNHHTSPRVMMLPIPNSDPPSMLGSPRCSSL